MPALFVSTTDGKAGQQIQPCADYKGSDVYARWVRIPTTHGNESKTVPVSLRLPERLLNQMRNEYFGFLMFSLTLNAER
ncbi:MAG: hypothetical protein B1H11_02395 [Desulfobacteraceae bacterium 4484_190.1]|nr:MAG: hypothetical protein B1H11_02395 [Desulfobacteraceae bacterium 4484_190.1]